jgi:filamentous hemagglutinin family protein
MNHIYRSIWNEASGAFVAVSENAKSGGKPASALSPVALKSRFAIRAMAASLLMAFGADAHALPVGGVVVEGKAVIANGAGGMTINQGSQNAVLNWQSFNIGAGETVRFVQPDSGAVALNRVLGSDPSTIFGNLSANGKVFLVNPNGILFGAGASVNVGGLVASTLDIADGDFMAGRFKFSGHGGAIVNQGTISTDGGYVALLGANVSNQGVIAARLGTVALAAGEAITLDVAGDGLLSVAVEQGALNALVDNGGMIRADGGQVLLSAQAAGKLLHTVVNNTGIIQAQTIDSSNGGIRLLGDMQTGAVHAGGTLDASAPAGGDGGFIDTSAATVTLDGALKVTTLAARGKTGTWLIDPYNLTISNDGGTTGGGFTANGNDSVINAATLQAALAGTNVEVSTGAGGTQAGNITVAAPLAWSAPTTLALTAAGGIAINAPISIGGGGGLNLTATAQAGITTTGLTFGNGASVDYGVTDQGGAFTLNSRVYKMVYTMAQFDAIDALNAVDGTALALYGAGLTGNYALATSLDATSTTYANALVGTNTGNATTRFTGRFDGLGHTITGLTINAPLAVSAGLFGALNTTNANGPSSISNIGLVGGSVGGNQFVGALVGRNYGNSMVQTSWAGSAVSGLTSTGGLVGRNDGTIQSSYTTGMVVGNVKTGGLTGYNQGGVVQTSYSTANVTGVSETGGLAGQSDTNATVKTSYAAGAVLSAGVNAGGLIGLELNSQTTASYWDTATTGRANSAGGAGAVGLSTAQLQGQEALPAGVTFSLGAGFAGGAAGLYPYLSAAFPDGRQVVSGFVDTGANVLVSVLGNGKPFASAVTGANGYYYASAAPDTLVSGDSVLVYTSRNAATGAGDGATLTSATGAAVMSRVAVTRNALTSTSSATLYSEVAAQLAQAEVDATNAANGDAAAIAAVAGGSKRVLSTSGASFTFDQAVTVDSNLSIQTVAPNAPITVAQPIMVNGASILTLNASGALQVNAPISVTGAGVLNFTAGAQAGVSTTGLVFGNGASINYAANLGGSFILNGDAYQMVYSMAQLDAIDSLNAVNGTALAAYGTGQSGNYALAGDLNASGAVYSRPLLGASAGGGQSNPLSGRFDGLGHTISGLAIAAPGGDYVGLVGTLNGAGASVSNLGLVGGSVSGANNTGALVGWVELGTVQTSYSSAAVTGTNVNTGGLLGFNIGTLQSSYSSGTVSGNLGVGGVVGWQNEISNIINSYATGAVSGVNHVGGLAGLSYGNVEGSHATGTVTGTSPTSGNIGGLIGYNHGVGKVVRNSYATGAVSGYEVTGGLVANNAFGTIDGSYATGTVSGHHWSGGLVGYNNDTIQNSYATGSVAAGSVAGGLLGRNERGMVLTSYATGAVSGPAGSGGLIGDNAGGTVYRSFWNSQTGAQATGIGTDNNNQSANAKGMSTSEMQTQANFTSATASNGNLNPSWDLAGTWVMNGGSGYPLLRSFLTSLTVTANNAGKIYDGQAYLSNNGVTYSITPDMGKLLGTLSYGGSSQGAINAGDYAITPAGLSSSGQQGYLISYVSGALTVGKADVTLAGTRAYDGTAAVAGGILSATGVNGESFAVAGLGDAGNLASANVQTGASLVTTTGLTLGASANGGLASNYNPLSTSGSAVSITKAAISLGTSNVVKIYDGDLSAAGSAIVTGGVLFGTDAISGGTFAYTDKNAGAGNKTVTISGVVVSDGNGGGNYDVSYVNNTASTINPYAVSLSGTRVYDGTNTAAAGIFSIGALVGSETLTLSGGGTVASGNAGDGKAVTLGTLALSDGGNGGVASNYTFSGGAQTVSITPAALTLAGTRAYDGTAAVAGGILSATGVNGESFAVAGLGDAGNLASANVQTGASLASTTGLTLGASANGGLASNYNPLSTAGSAVSITKAAISLGTSNVVKIYDGDLSAAGSAIVTGGVLFGTDAISRGTFAYTDKNAGAGNKTVTTSGVAISDGNGGGNYDVSYVNNTASTINPYAVSLSGTRVYDGTNTAAAGIFSIGALVGSETLTLSGGGTVASGNAGDGKAVTLGTLALSDGGNGGVASNYTFSGGAQTVSITPAALTLAGTRAYDGTAAVAGGILSATGVNGESFAVAGLGDAGNLASANVQTGASLASTTGLTLGASANGGLASNYNPLSTAGSAVSITKAAISLGTSNVVKIYDGDLSAAGSAIVTGGVLFGTDAISRGTFAYTDKNAGAGNKTVTTSGVAISDGNGGGNYDVSYVNNTASTINPYAVSLSGTRVYDGTNTAAAGIFSIGALVGSEMLTLSGGGTVASGNAGNGKAVTLGTLSLNNGGNGGLASNYTFSGGTQTVNITPANVIITGLSVSGEKANDKVYDGTTAAIIDTSLATLHGVIAGDEVSLVTSGVTGSFADKNVGANKGVTVTGNAIAGASAANYTVSDPTGLTASITKASISLGTGNVVKTYDGGVVAAGSASVTGGVLFGTDAISGGTFAYTDKNAGAGNKTVTTSGVVISDGNGGGNYDVSYVNNTASTINPYAVSLAGSRSYNGTKTVVAGIFSIGALVGSETLTLSGGGTVASGNAGNGKAVTLGTLALNDGVNGGLASNYTFNGGTQTVNITPANVSITGLTVSGEKANDKVYDGTTAAVIDTGLAVLHGVIDGDEVSLVTSGVTGSFADKNVGVNKDVTVSGNAIAGASAANYTVSDPTGLTANITKAPISLGTSNVVKTYDGGVVAAGSASVTGGVLFGTDAISGGTFAYTDKNAGAGNKTVTTSGVVISDGNGGGNYDISYVNNTGSTINPYAVSLVGTREYDGTTNVAADIFTIGALVGAETLTLSGGGTIASGDVGNGKAVGLGTLALNNGGNGGLASNYTFGGGTQTASITPAPVIITGLSVSGEKANDKVYDGTTAATIDTSLAVLHGVIAGDEVNLVTGGVTGSFADKNVGINKGVTVTGNALAGASSGNYTVSDPTGLTASITKAPISLGAGNVVKTYDGTVSAAGSVILAGGVLFGADAISGGTFAYTDKNAGAGNKTVTTSGVAISDGNGGGNYEVRYVDNTTSTINPYVVSLDGSRVYDRTDNAAAGIFGIGALVGAETLTLSGSGTVASGDVGNGKAVAVGTLALNNGGDGGLASNYTLIGGTRTLSITPANVNITGLTVSGEKANDKVYDGTTVAVIDASLAVLNGVIAGDRVELVTSGVTGSFADKNVGANKDVTVTGNAIAGASAGNYTVSDPTGLTASITKAPISLGTGNVVKTYDGTLLAAGSASVTAGVLFGTDAVGGGSFAYTDKNAGAGNKTVTTSGVVISDGNGGGNYEVSYVDNIASTIKPYAVSLTGTRVYDGTSGVAAGIFTIGALVGVETLTLSGAGTVAGGNAGNGKAVALGTLALNNGGNGGLASNYTFSGGTQTAGITPATLTANAIGQTKVFGEDDPLLAYSVSGLVAGDALDKVVGGKLLRDPGESSGLYGINQGSLASTDSNYSVAFVPAAFRILPTDQQSNALQAAAQGPSQTPSRVLYANYTEGGGRPVPAITILGGGMHMPDEWTAPK